MSAKTDALRAHYWEDDGFREVDCGHEERFDDAQRCQNCGAVLCEHCAKKHCPFCGEMP